QHGQRKASQARLEGRESLVRRYVSSSNGEVCINRLADYRKTGELLLVANGVDADDCARCVLDRLIAGDAWYADNRSLAVVWVTCVDRVESRAAQFASKRLWQSRCYADVFVALALHEIFPEAAAPAADADDVIDRLDAHHIFRHLVTEL